MHDHSLFLETTYRFARVLLTDFDLDLVLVELSESVTEVLDLAGCGVSLARGERLEFGIAVPKQLAMTEKVQAELQEGPCVSAFRGGTTVAIRDLREESQRWAEYCAAAERADLRSVASIPMRLGDQTVGALNLYGRGPREWPEDDLAAATVMAGMATAYLINASQLQQQRRLTNELQGALASRVIIEQAKGVLSEAESISPDEAFGRIRRHARNSHTKIHDVAYAVVRDGLRVKAST